ncbi:MAG: hypothetical protein WC466_02920 [Candidatus Izemoplasmatales bacterium]
MENEKNNEEKAFCKAQKCIESVTSRNQIPACYALIDNYKKFYDTQFFYPILLNQLHEVEQKLAILGN